MSSQLLNIKLKLEEKRRQIENDKRKMESLMNRQRQQVGKAAFFQAVTRVIFKVYIFVDKNIKMLYIWYFRVKMVVEIYKALIQTIAE